MRWEKSWLNTTPHCPSQGDIIYLDFDPQAGNEQAGRRPALVLSPASYNAVTRLAVVCPITSRAKGYPFEVAIPPGLKVYGVVLADHVKSLSWSARNAAFADQVPPDVVEDVKAKLAALLE